MSLISKDCIEYEDNRKVCTAAEGGKKYELINNSGRIIRKVKIDKCLPQKEQEKRCDYLMNVNDENKNAVYYIELKGGAILDGCIQIEQTMIYLKNEFKDFVIFARIVASRSVPDIRSDSVYLRLSKKIKIISTDGNIKYSTNKFFTETI
jgi:hypothetical protein